MTEVTRPVYLFFTMWVQMDRQIKWHDIPAKDAYLASGDNNRWLRATIRPIILMQSGYRPTSERDLERWHEQASIARDVNDRNGFETEVRDV